MATSAAAQPPGSGSHWAPLSPGGRPGLSPRTLRLPAGASVSEGVTRPARAFGHMALNEVKPLR